MTVTGSLISYYWPDLLILTPETISCTTAKISKSLLGSVPKTVSPIWNVPVIELSAILNCANALPPSVNLVTVVTIDLAPE